MARPKNPANTLHKICPTCGTPFTCERRKEKTYCSKKCACNAPEVKEKNRSGVATCFQEKYGCHPMQTDATKEHFKRAMINAYGVSHPGKMADHMEKIKKTNLERHGDENYNNIDQIRQTCLERYGVENINQSEEHHTRSAKAKKDNHYDSLCKTCEELKLRPLFSKADYKGYHFTNVYKFECVPCGHTFEALVYNRKYLQCPKCSPTGKNKIEGEIYDFLCSILPKGELITLRDRTILYGKELDFYLPERKLAIEHNGLYWHSESTGGVGKSYHLNKTKACMSHGIRLIHIREDEWLYKKDIVKSILSSAVGVPTTKLHGRECVVREVPNKDKKEFLERNHLQGNDFSSVSLGLYHKEELVSLMTFGKSRYEKRVHWEIFRYCNKLSTSITGGSQKLFQTFIKNYSPESIISYSDRRYFSGEVYHRLGFRFVNFTSAGYHYINTTYKQAFNRTHFQKHKLKSILKEFSSEKTEWENMQANGFDRIWDCGHSKWVWIKPSR